MFCSAGTNDAARQAGHARTDHVIMRVGSERACLHRIQICPFCKSQHANVYILAGLQTWSSIPCPALQTDLTAEVQIDLCGCRSGQIMLKSSPDPPIIFKNDDG